MKAKGGRTKNAGGSGGGGLGGGKGDGGVKGAGGGEGIPMNRHSKSQTGMRPPPPGSMVHSPKSTYWQPPTPLHTSV